MRVVTGDARFAWIMGVLVYLRKTSGPGCVILMTVNAIVALFRRHGFYFRGIIDMLLRSAVT